VPVTCPSCGEENPERARFCLSCAASLESEPAPEERKLATVLFADLVGSTALADDQDPERTRMVLNRFYDAMTEEVERCGGTVEKFAGDAVMAAFGAPSALEDHAERALHAAISMQRRLSELFTGRLSLRIGVNTGEVVVGQPREGSSFVTGDAVNVAARLEQAASAGETLAGERTVAAARGAFEFGDPATIQAKGKSGGVIARRVLRALSLMRPRGVRGLPSVFVGREAEFEQLTDRYDRVVAEGEPHLVSIVGEAGVGKTRLTREIWGWLSTRSPVPTRRTGRTLSYGQGATYWPLGEVLKEHFGISESDPPEAVTAQLGDHPYLGLTLGLAVDEDLHPLVARERLHDAWVEFLQGLVRERPGVLLIEDLHWAEDDLCDLIDTLVSQVQGPLLVLATARPEMIDRRPAWGGAWRRTSAMRLEALPSADTDRLLVELLGDEVPTAIRDLVVERAEGNPFFVEELIGTLIDRGVLTRDDGTWTFGELPAGFTVPDSVQAVLSARIDMLPGVEKAALQAAAVIGRTFWTGPVYELVAGESPDIGLLEERDFVRRRAGSSLAGEREYVIKHALTREVAYGSLPKATRARMHAVFAAWLERRAEGRDELAPLIAHHLAEAVRPEDLDLAWPGQDERVRELRAGAVAWSRRAAELTVGRYEIDDALALLHRAVGLEPDPAQRASLWVEIGHACALKYDGEGFVAAMDEAHALGAPEADVYPELAYQTAQRAGMWRRRLDDSIVEGWIERAVAVAPGGTPARVRALVAKAYWYDDLAAAHAALTAAEALGDVQLRSDGLGTMQNALAQSGRFVEARETAELRAELLPAISDPDNRADALYMTAELHSNLGRLAEARAIVDRLERTVAGLTPHHRVHGLGGRVRLEAAVGDWQTVRGLTQPIEDAVEANLGTPCPFNVGLLLLCALGMVLGSDEAEAARLVAKAESIGMVGYGQFHSARWLCLAIAREDREEARRIVDSVEPSWLTLGAWELWAALFDALAMLDDRDRIEADAPRWMQREAYVAPFALRALGIARSDRSLLADAEARFDAMGLGWHADKTREALSRLGA
jgi:class 3 adenylate cyclase/tetratricopeptide (TPR) repeat protein